MNEPLHDFSARVMCLNPNVAINIDLLLRLQNTHDKKKPITLYILGTTSSPALPLMDAITLCSVIRTLRTPVTTIGMGIIQNNMTLVLAAGTHRRWLLPHTVISLSPQQWQGLVRVPIGLNRLARPKPDLFEAQFEALLLELKLSPHLFQSEQHFEAEQAIENNLADEIIGSPQPQIKNPNPIYER